MRSLTTLFEKAVCSQEGLGGDSGTNVDVGSTRRNKFLTRWAVARQCAVSFGRDVSKSHPKSTRATFAASEGLAYFSTRYADVAVDAAERGDVVVVDYELRGARLSSFLRKRPADSWLRLSCVEDDDAANVLRDAPRARSDMLL